ncbi:AMP-ligase [Lysobacteraceae bacterium NML120232]|nr:AMP-ligase [Xanthomonadaceae bacterium NML08-0793]PJK09790.1 AMP-ligase [Xanthomonadaceae bacterium NML120232]
MSVSTSVFSGVLDLLPGDPDALLFCGAQPVRRGDFLRRVTALAATLPDAPALINLCERRDHFIAAFCAAALRGQVTLLPPSRAPQMVAEVAAAHPQALRVGDMDEIDCDVRVDKATAHTATIQPARVEAAQLAMIGFTSGSTGQPSAHRKCWGALGHTDAVNQQLLTALCGGAAHIVATVPPQHMYGMELSVLLPLFGAFAVHPGRPFFPEDIARALAECDAPRLLVTTPVHLRALLESGVALPPLAGIVSATAPLAPALAARAEARFGCQLRELFGATEVCIFAERRPSHETTWRLLDQVRLQPEREGTQVFRPSLPQPVMLADMVELSADGRSFELRGRQADLLEIAGKRASLADLTRRLQAIEGVVDGAMLQLDADAAGVRRLLAVVVAPGMDDATLIAHLRQASDPVFLPRRIIRVAALPRNETGKLPRQALLALLAEADQGAGDTFTPDTTC